MLAPEIPCSPCFWQAKPGLRASAGRGPFEQCRLFANSCLESIGVDSVVRAAAELLPQGQGGGAASARPR